MKKLVYIFFLISIISCSNQETNQQENESTSNDPKSSESVTFSKEQIELAEIKTGKFEKRNISEIVQCTGSIEVPPKNLATVSPIISGFIKSLNYQLGESVQKGAVLASLQHPDFINLQQQYIEAKSQVDYYQQEFKRQGELTVENAASMKNMQKAKADYYTYEANYKSLKSQLELLGVKTEEIEKGDFVKEFKVTAPISGIISQLNANTGKFVNSDGSIYEIIDDSNLHLHLNVFEKDIPKISKGQKIVFRFLNSNKDYETKVEVIGSKIDEKNRSTMVHGLIVNKNHFFKPGMHVNASILINEKNVYVLPSEAVIDIDKESFIFIKENDSFKKMKIEKGVEQNNYCEIIGVSQNLANAEIVVKGTYYLLSALISEE